MEGLCEYTTSGMLVKGHPTLEFKQINELEKESANIFSTLFILNKQDVNLRTSKSRLVSPGLAFHIRETGRSSPWKNHLLLLAQKGPDKRASFPILLCSAIR